MAIDLLEWCGRHGDALFVTFLVSAGIYVVARVIGAIAGAVTVYRARAR